MNNSALYVLLQEYINGEIDKKVPDAPSTPGSYILKATVGANGTKTYEWANASDLTGWVGASS